ncbi:ABC transporter ATP-binding protein [Tunturibacter empetritectus]|uniref:Subfamily B ATP-binding cassette protein MsbA n=1 Tax=Tunturiibacter lichenicola TaxID=2051959 RepID=A0A7W8J9P8_9BACT|nr:ABC transporter ATP-binding protein [Edaphobacter lichenicola]MBB5345248.1 subfamily B ATP-binding cassette protein MsbA [Edaphobacter lichenicola]
MKPPSRLSSDKGTLHASDRGWKPELVTVIPEIWMLVKPFRWLIFGCFALMIVNRICSLAVPVAFRYLVNDVMYGHHFDKLALIIGAVAGATCIQGVTTFFLSQKLSIAGQRLIADLRKQVQNHIGRLPISFYDGSRAGDLTARIMNDAEGVRDLVGAGLVDLAGGMLTAIIALALLLRISTLMTMLTFCILIGFGFFLKTAFGVTRPIFHERSKLTAEVAGRLTESLAAVRVVKGYRAEASEANVFANGAERILKNHVSSIRAQSWMSLASTILFGIVGGLIMYLGALEVKGHRLDVGSYVEFIMLLAFMVAPIALLVSVGSQLMESIAKLHRTAVLLREPSEDSEICRTQMIGPIQGSVVFRGVSFTYTTGKAVLHGVQFEADPGTVTALVGASGAGKSTIISLICGFYIPVSGQIFIDDVDLSTVRLDSYRQQLGVVLQDTFLFDGSIRENVLFSRPGAHREEWLEACRIARVDEFVERLPDQYETVVGERGIRLSGGQRQRISIARAILANPRILILDEATSSLDSESEAMIQAGLNALMRGRTTFVIAHRLSTIRRADQILVLDRGKIVERGTHESLYTLQRHYYDFYTRQHGLESNLFVATGEGDLCPTPV